MSLRKGWLTVPGALLLVTLFSAPGRANVTPCGTLGEHLDGAATTFQNSIFGARANIGIEQPEICGSTSVSVIWSMVAAGSAIQSGTTGWAQAGCGQFGSQSGYSQSGYKEFAQFTKWCASDGTCASGYPVTKFNGQPPASGNPIASAFQKADNAIHMYYDQIQIAVTDFNVASAWNPSWSAQFSAETHHLGSDVPGYSDAKVHVTNLQKATDNTSDWANIQSTTSQSPDCRYHYQGVGSGTDFDVWTYPPYSLTC